MIYFFKCLKEFMNSTSTCGHVQLHRMKICVQKLLSAHLAHTLNLDIYFRSVTTVDLPNYLYVM